MDERRDPQREEFDRQCWLSPDDVITVWPSEIWTPVRS